MSPKPNLPLPLLAIPFLLLSTTLTCPSLAGTGVCYGTLATNLPPPRATLSLLKQHNIHRVRLYTPEPSILQSLSSSSIELMLDVPNTALSHLAASQQNAATWIRQNILTHPNVAFRYIVVGNEVRPNNGNARHAPFLLHALKNIQAEVLVAGLGGHIKVSTAFDYGVVRTTGPPSSGAFDDRIGYFLGPVIRFLADNGAPLMMNVHPYLSYVGGASVRLDYALFEAPGSVVVKDPANGLEYRSVFDEMVDAVYSALDRVQAGSVAVVVSESGWPTGGGKGATVENARRFNNNLIRNVRDGTPKKRGREQETYVFAMYDESLRKGSPFERHWGLFDGFTLKYPIKF